FHPSDRHGSLEANMIEIRADDRRLLIVSTDTLYGGVLGETIAADLGYRSHEVLVLGSHTHYAPGVDPALNLGPTDDDYVRYATEQCAEAIKSAPWRDDVSASWASRPTENLFTNRRHPTLGIGV